MGTQLLSTLVISRSSYSFYFCFKISVLDLASVVHDVSVTVGTWKLLCRHNLCVHVVFSERYLFLIDSKLGLVFASDYMLDWARNELLPCTFSYFSCYWSMACLLGIHVMFPLLWQTHSECVIGKWYNQMSRRDLKWDLRLMERSACYLQFEKEWSMCLILIRFE